jgi:hypothetical protein
MRCASKTLLTSTTLALRLLRTDFLTGTAPFCFPSVYDSSRTSGMRMQEPRGGLYRPGALGIPTGTSIPAWAEQFYVPKKPRKLSPAGRTRCRRKRILPTGFEPVSPPGPKWEGGVLQPLHHGSVLCRVWFSKCLTASQWKCHRVASPNAS